MLLISNLTTSTPMGLLLRKTFLMNSGSKSKAEDRSEAQLKDLLVATRHIIQIGVA